jgi:hypothetical protein
VSGKAKSYRSLRVKSQTCHGFHGKLRLPGIFKKKSMRVLAICGIRVQRAMLNSNRVSLGKKEPRGDEQELVTKEKEPISD